MSSPKKQKNQQHQEEQKGNAVRDVPASFFGLNSFGVLQNVLSFLPYRDLVRMQWISKIGRKESLKAFSLITSVDASPKRIDRLYKLQWKVEDLRAVAKNCRNLDSLKVAKIETFGEWKMEDELQHEIWELASEIIKNNKKITKFVGLDLDHSFWIPHILALQLPLTELTCSFDLQFLKPQYLKEQSKLMVKQALQFSHGNQLKYLKFEALPISRMSDPSNALGSIILDPIDVLESCPQLETLSFHPRKGEFGEHKTTENEQNIKISKLTSLEITSEDLQSGELLKILTLTPNLRKFKCPLNHDLNVIATYCRKITKLHLDSIGFWTPQGAKLYEVLTNLPDLSELVFPLCYNTGFCDCMERLRKSEHTLVALKSVSAASKMSAKNCEDLAMVAPNITVLRICEFRNGLKVPEDDDHSRFGKPKSKYITALQMLWKKKLKLRVLFVEKLGERNFKFLANKEVFPELRMLGGNKRNHVAYYWKNKGLKISNCRNVEYGEFFMF